MRKVVRLVSYRKLSSRHHQHHTTPARPAEDPDFHDGAHPGFGRWYLNFLSNYIGLAQGVGMAAAFNLLEHGLGVPLMNLLLFWVAPALLSTLQLSYFGTYLPHREPHPTDDAHRARSLGYQTVWSFLACYHFGYHREHHEHPQVPWRALAEQRRGAELPAQARTNSAA